MIVVDSRVRKNRYSFPSVLLGGLNFRMERGLLFLLNAHLRPIGVGHVHRSKLYLGDEHNFACPICHHKDA